MGLVKPAVAEELEDAYQVLGRVLGRIHYSATGCISQDTGEHVRHKSLPEWLFFAEHSVLQGVLHHLGQSDGPAKHAPSAFHLCE